MTCFEMYYPISISKTENPKNYLILDELYSPIDYSELKITQVFPKSIPDCATEVDYEYRCEPSRMCWMIKAAWCLPNEEYFAEKQRIKGSTQSPVEFDELEYYSFFGEREYGHVEFNDDMNVVIYYDTFGYY